MTYRLRILPRAEADVDHIFTWLWNREPAGALRWYAAFERAARALPASPLGYSRAPEAEFADLELRQFFFKTPRGRTYRGVFVMVDDEIQILRVRGPGQRRLQPDELADDD